MRDGRLRPDHVPLHDGGLLRLAGGLVVLLERHDQHGVGVFPELHQVRHAADGAGLGLGEGRLVDRAVLGHEAVVGRVEGPAGVVAVRLGPALVLGLEDAAGVVAQLDQRADLAGLRRAVGLEQDAAIGDGLGVAVLDLADDLVVADEEAAFGDVAERRRGHEGGFRVGSRRHSVVDMGQDGGGFGRSALTGPPARQPCHGLLQLAGQVAVRQDAESRRHRACPSGSSRPAPSRGGSGSSG